MTSTFQIKSTRVEFPKMPAPISEFRPFSRLPKELRTMIWRGASRNERRIVKVVLNKPGIKSWDSQVAGQLRHPGVMQASKESRAVGGEYYSLCHENQQARRASVYTEVKNGGHNTVGNRGNVMEPICNPLFINFDLDVFVLSSNAETSIRLFTACNLQDDELERVQHFHHFVGFSIFDFPTKILGAGTFGAYTWSYEHNHHLENPKNKRRNAVVLDGIGTTLQLVLESCEEDIGEITVTHKSLVEIIEE